MWMETLFHELGEPRYRPCPLLRRMVREGKLGKKIGRGILQVQRRRKTDMNILVLNCGSSSVKYQLDRCGQRARCSPAGWSTASG